MTRRTTLAVLLTSLGAVAPVLAAEMIVQGQVVDVVPLTAGATADCDPPKPAPGASLVALLEWDLRTTCAGVRRQATVSGYRVYYRWDGRTYSHVMREPPGETVSLRVQVQ